MDIKVALVEDDALVREELARLISREPGFVCVGAYSDGETALVEIPKKKPDVVLMDINLPGVSGIDCIRSLKTACPAVSIVMLTVYDEVGQLFKSLMAGASGYLLKRLSPKKLIEAIEEVCEGGSPMSAPIARKVVQSFKTVPPKGDESVDLSPREQSVLNGLAAGLVYKQIADQLGVSIHTVRNYIRRIYEKLHVCTRTEAVAKFLRK